MKVLLSLLIVSTLLFSCKSKSALAYNQSIGSIETSMKADILTTEEKVAKFFDQQKYDSAFTVSEKMEKIADAKLQEINDLKAPDAKGADALKKAAVRYFSAIKAIYTGYKNCASVGTDEQAFEKERIKLMSSVEEKDKSIANIQSEQQRFADANGFKMERH